MFDALERQVKLTTNQKKLIATAMLGDMFEFFDYFLIGFVLSKIASSWKLTFLESSIVLLSSGIGAIFGAFIWGRVADMVGRRKVFIATILNLSVATALMALTPEGGWWYLTAMRFFVGFGVGGLYCVDLPLVQEFVPSRRRGRIGGLVTAFVPVGLLLGSVSGAFLIPLIGWRGVCLGQPTHLRSRAPDPGLGAGIAALADAAGSPRGGARFPGVGAPGQSARPSPCRRPQWRNRRRNGGKSSSIRAAWSYPASAISAPKLAAMASAFGSRRCSCSSCTSRRRAQPR